MRLFSRTVPIATPEDPFRLLGDDPIVFCREGLFLAGAGETFVSTSRCDSSIEGILASAHVKDEVVRRGTGPIAFGAFTFDPDDQGSRTVIPRLIIGGDDEGWWQTTTWIDGERSELELSPSPSTRRGEFVSLGSSIDEAAWMEGVRLALKEIANGELEKVVLAKDLLLEADGRISPVSLTRAFFEAFPTCYTFCHSGWVGASPELLVSRQADRLRSVPLAGTVGRSSEPAADLTLRSGLIASDKQRREHQIAVKSVIDALSIVCDEVRPDADPHVLSLSNVQHLATLVTGRLKEDTPLLKVVGLLHPTAAVAGAPRSTAMKTIDKLEPFSRGIYAGPVGWVDGKGDGEWAIALRCVNIQGERARLFAGSGLVAGSDPEEELAEIAMKLKAAHSTMQQAKVVQL